MFRTLNIYYSQAAGLFSWEIGIEEYMLIQERLLITDHVLGVVLCPINKTQKTAL